MILRRKPLTLMTAIIIVIGVAAVTTTTGAYAQLSPPSSSQQNMTSLNATNATAVVAINNTTAATPTRIITQLLGVRGEVIPLHMENIQFQQEDPLFAKLVQVINDCMNFVVAQQQEGHIDQLDNNRKFACDSVISLGVEQFCGFSPRADILECAEANQMQLYYMVTAGASGFPT